MQRSPVVDPGMLAIPPTEGSMDLELLLHDPLLPPDKATEPPDKDPPKQIQAPADVRGLRELPWGKALWHVTWHNGQLRMHRLEGKAPLREAHRCPSDLPDLCSHCSVALEQVVIDPKAPVRTYQAQRPVPDKGTHTCPEL